MLVPFTYTHVEYEAGDALGRAAALASLAPIFFVVALATSLAQRRDLGTAALLAGQLANEVLNTALKRALRAPRPTSLHPHAPAFGMPSNHAQFAAFSAAYLAIWALSGRWRVAAGWRRAAAAAAAAAALVVAASRVYLRYHTPAQVAVGAAVGAAAAAAWFAVVEALLRPHFAAVAATPLARALLVRDCSEANVLEREYKAVQRER